MTAATVRTPLPSRGAPSRSATAARSGDAVATWCVVMLLSVVLEGAVRKWILPESMHWLAAIPYLAKDFIALAFIVRFGIPVRARLARRLIGPVVCVAIALAPAAILGLVISVPNAVITYKNAVIWPVFALSLAANLTPVALKRITLTLAGLCIISAVLGAWQYSSPASARINAYAWSSMESDISEFAHGKVRATGTFSYISGFAAFGIASFCWLYWRYLSGEHQNRAPIIWMGLGSSIVIMLTSGSRAPIVMTVAVLVISQLTLTSAKARIRSLVVMTGLLLLGGIIMATSDIIQSWWTRWTTASDTVQDRVTMGGLTFVDIVMANPIGRGLGEQSQLSAYKQAASGATNTIYIDDTRSRVADEAGLLGLIALALSTLMVAYLSLRFLFGKDRTGRAGACVFGVPTFWFTFSCLWYDHNTTALWWLCIALWIGAGSFRRSAAPVYASLNALAQRLPARPRSALAL